MSTLALWAPHALHSPLAHVEKSNLPPEKKTAIRAYWDGLHDRMDALSARNTQASPLATSLNTGAGTVGHDVLAYALGWAAAYVKSQNGGSLDFKGVPLDAVAAALFAVGSGVAPYMGMDAITGPLRTASIAASTLFGFRQGEKKYSHDGASVKGESLADCANDL